jgi:hypothetical protein
MVHPVKRSAAIASAGRPVAAARVLPMPAMIGAAAALGKAGCVLSPRQNLAEIRSARVGLAAPWRATRMMPAAMAC